MGERKRTTVSIVDVARRAGVSVSTVSRSLRGEGNVAEATRDRVRRAAEELAYVPSAAASGLASGRTHGIAVLAAFSTRWFLTAVLEGAEGVLREAGYDLLLHNVGDAAAREGFFAGPPIRRRVDAVLALATTLSASERAALARLSVPLAAVDGRPGIRPRVGVDDEIAAMTAVRHLLLLGHRDIAMISGNADGSDGQPSPRHTGFATAVAAGPGGRADVLVTGSTGVEGGIRGAEQLLSRSSLPSAVFAESDEMAFGVLSALRRTGVRVPEDVSLIGFDDHDLAAAFDLTTIAQPAREQGAVAAGLLLRLIAGTADPQTEILLPTRLVARGSTRRVGPPVPPGPTASERS